MIKRFTNLSTANKLAFITLFFTVIGIATTLIPTKTPTNIIKTSGNNSPSIQATTTVHIHNDKNSNDSDDKFTLLSKLDVSGFHKIKNINKKDISALLDSVFTFEEHDTEDIAIVVNMVAPENEDFVEQVVTCRRYNYLKEKGYYAKTNWDIKYSSRLNKSCQTLRYLLLVLTSIHLATHVHQHLATQAVKKYSHHIVT